VALGVPTDGDPSDDYWMDKGVYVLSYSDRLRDPSWVAWKLVKSDLGAVKRSESFRADDDLPSAFAKVGKADYSASGYDRGHMCPSAQRTATAEMNSLTFLMTNMQPQIHALNAGPWAALEAYERDLASQGKVVFIVAGGIFSPSPKTIGPNGVAVPESNFRVTVVLEEGQGAKDVTETTPVFATIMPNGLEARGHDWTDFEVAVDDIEQKTGYDFLSALDDVVETSVESRVVH
jgi:endonuclease G